MSPETIRGVVTILVVGITILLIAGLLDWRSKKRADRAAKDLPEREIPGLHEELHPDYVTEDELKKSRAWQTLTSDEAAELEEELADAETFGVGGQPGLTTHESPRRSILRNVLVMVVPEAGMTIREALPTLERAVAEKAPILIASSALDPQLVDLLAANLARGVLESSALAMDSEDLERLCTISGATPITRAELQSGFTSRANYGRLALLVSDQKQTQLLGTDSSEDEE